MLSNKTFKFLKDLKKNNNRDWFQDNKPRYQEAMEDFHGFIDALISNISKFDKEIAHNTAKDRVFRIYRDVRFSKDKSPYKTHFGAHITSAVKRSDIHTAAGYYIHIGPGESMLAGGAYVPEKEWLANIRNAIDLHAKDFKKILNSKKFKEYFGEMEGEQLKTAPKGYPKDHPEIDLLRHKSFLATHYMPDKQITSKDLLKHCTNVFKAMKPFDDFLNQVR